MRPAVEHRRDLGKRVRAQCPGSGTSSSNDMCVSQRTGISALIDCGGGNAHCAADTGSTAIDVARLGYGQLLKMLGASELSRCCSTSTSHGPASGLGTMPTTCSSNSAAAASDLQVM